MSSATRSASVAATGDSGELEITATQRTPSRSCSALTPIVADAGSDMPRLDDPSRRLRSQAAFMARSPSTQVRVFDLGQNLKIFRIDWRPK
jgi:hypothetical protein